jgi:hypothetical protein
MDLPWYRITWRSPMIGQTIFHYRVIENLGVVSYVRGLIQRKARIRNL